VVEGVLGGVAGEGLDGVGASSSSSSSTSPARSQPTQRSSNGSLQQRLQLRVRLLHGLGGSATAVPPAKSAGERTLLRERAKHARGEYQKKQVAVVEKTLEQNRFAFDLLTSCEETEPEDLTAVAMEQQYLKKELQQRREQEEVEFEVGGEVLTFWLRRGECVCLEGVPGRPEVVWTESARPVSVVRRGVWQTSHSAPLGVIFISL
jgi:hypothetical protein